MKVLVVDDDAAGLEIRRLVLERHGFAVIPAADARAARDAFASNRPDVVVLDLRVPEVEDGLALIREFQGARIVVLCGNRADLDHRAEAKLVYAILGKPVRSDEILKHVRGD
jgi:DNA-binding response OmpR family regulator